MQAREFNTVLYNLTIAASEVVTLWWDHRSGMLCCYYFALSRFAVAHLQECRVPFGNGNFFEHDGLPYCETRFHAHRGSLCAGCHKPVTGRCITAMYRKYHPEHFVCTFCQCQLNKGTFKEENDKPYCHPCFVRLFSWYSYWLSFNYMPVNYVPYSGSYCAVDKVMDSNVFLLVLNTGIIKNSWIYIRTAMIAEKNSVLACARQNVQRICFWLPMTTIKSDPFVSTLQIRHWAITSWSYWWYWPPAHIEAIPTFILYMLFLLLMMHYDGNISGIVGNW